ncbi:MAG: hypothetical protein RLZZ117_2643 [Cyanobacteriota bacterium]|jgi:hypothetical protein
MNAPLRSLTISLLAGAALSSLSLSPAEAVVVNIGGTAYDVSVAETSSDSSSNLFALPPLGQMPWWGDDLLASDAATQVFNLLGSGWDPDYGPVFAYDASMGQVMGLAQSLSDPLDQIDVTPATGATVRYAIASTPVPGALPLLGAAEMVRRSRRLRKRISGR